MTYLLCRNKVKDFKEWKKIFESHADAHRKAGLLLAHLWHELDDPNHLFFLFEVHNVERARDFINGPEAAQAGKEAGLLEGEMHFLESQQNFVTLL